MKTFQRIITENKENGTINRIFQQAAEKEGIFVVLGREDRIVSLPIEPIFEAVAVNDDFVKALNSFGAKMTPNLEELKQSFAKQSDNQVIVIQTEQSDYEANVELNMLSKRLDLWVNLDQLTDLVK